MSTAPSTRVLSFLEMDSTRLQQRKIREKKLLSKRQQRSDPYFREAENRQRRLRRQKQKQRIEEMNEKIKVLTEQNSQLRTELHNLSQNLHSDTAKNNSNCQLNQSIPIWEQEVSRLLQHPYLERLIGITLSEFNHYLKSIGEVLPFLNVNGDCQVDASACEISRSDKVHLFSTLYWLRQYPTVVNLETIFSIPCLSFSCLGNRTFVALDSTLEDTAMWPEDDEFEEIIWKFRDVFPTQFRQHAVIVDGTEIRIPRPKDSDAEKATYSVKKKQHSITLLMMCTPDGKLIHCSKVLTGTNDQSHWNSFNYRAWFENKNYRIAGDGGFTFNHKDSKLATKEIPIHCFTPFKRPSNGTLSDIVRN
jgi:hypothetical protein